MSRCKNIWVYHITYPGLRFRLDIYDDHMDVWILCKSTMPVISTRYGVAIIDIALPRWLQLMKIDASSITSECQIEIYSEGRGVK